MTILESLRFVQGAVAKRDLVPELQHFRIEGRKVTGYNGSLGLCAPIDIDLDITPSAVQFVKAIRCCDEEIALSEAKGGRLLVKSGKFRSSVACVDPDDYPFKPAGGERVDLNVDLISILKKMEPFIAIDASRPWACGILLRGASAFATNNIAIMEYWIGSTFPVEVNIPHVAVRELLRIKQNPIQMQMSENSVTFYFEGGAWLTTLLCMAQWPDLTPILDKPSVQFPVCEQLTNAIARLIPFTDELNRCYMHNTRISTAPADETDCTQIEVPAPEVGCYNAEELAKVLELAHSIDLGAYPLPSVFYGDKIRGAIVGLRS
jgi:DNA polymerase III sliding clamp (beta) subunit (PCNA family)